MQKIIIFGFPHSGTTILRNIVSHIDSVIEIVDEVKFIQQSDIDAVTDESKKFILCKWPRLIDCNDEKYNDYIKIFILRNPLFSFSSLNKKRDYKFGPMNNVNRYLKTAEYFVQCQNNNQNNIYTLRYEDMFENNHEKLRNIFDKIGFEYTNEIFNNQKFNNKVQFGKYLKVPKTLTSQKKHAMCRLYQINQTFVNNNNLSNIDLLESQVETLKNDVNVMTIYPEIETLIPQITCKKDADVTNNA